MIEPGRGYYAREVLRILGVKAHVLRYWEQSLPIVRPRRDESGHRVWTAAQLRMLLRVRHLVVTRGMSVAAAGEALLHEAEPTRADAKARLEALRARLVTLLLRTRAHRTADPAPSHPEPDAADAGGDDPVPTEPSPPARTLELAAVVSVPPRRRAEQDRGDAPAPQSLGIVEPGQSPLDEQGIAWAGVPVSHLFAEGPAPAIAAAVTDLLARRGAGNPRRWQIVPVPAADMPVYRAALQVRFRADEVYPVPVYPLRHGGVRWWSPRLATLIALAGDPSLEQELHRRGIETLYVYAPDDPAVPSEPAVDGDALRTHGGATGLIPAMQRRRAAAARRLVDATLLDLRRWRPAMPEVLGYGVWRWSNHGGGDGAGGSTALDGSGGWRYDIWQYHLVRAAGCWYELPADPRPVPWRGAGWLAEVAAVWGPTTMSGAPEQEGVQ